MSALDIDWSGDDDAGGGSAELGGPLPMRMVDHAQAYAARSVPVFPCNPQPGPSEKAPLVKGGFKSATTDPAQIRRLWAKHPNALIGVPTGPKSGWLVIDPDAVEPGKPDGLANWAALQAEHGAVSPTRSHLTQGGGLHVLFRYPEKRGIGIKEGKLAGKGIHVRGDGGYAIVPPSRMADGRSYSLADPALEWTLAEAPPWLLDMIAAEPKAEARKAGGLPSQLPAHIEAEAPDGIVVPKFDVPKPTPGAVAKVCPTFVRMLEDAPTAGEVIWWKTCQLALYTTGGADLAHMAAAKHPDYDPDTTQAKIDRHAAGSFGPPTCGNLQTVYGDTSPCLSCPHFSNPSTSPVVIARRAVSRAVATADRERLEDFVAFLPENKFIHRPTEARWPAASVDGRLPRVPVRSDDGGEPKLIRPSAWLTAHQAVAQVTWHPGEPELIRGRISREGELVPAPGSDCLNLYKPPPPSKGGDANAAGRWLDLVRLVYPDEADHLVAWMAHRVQHPGDKVNHAIVLGGVQGVGKDTIVQPLVEAVAPWNVTEIAPAALLGQFNSHVKSVVLRISEVRNLGDQTRQQFYEQCKTLITAPPNSLRVNEKHRTEYHIKNCCGVIITTNHKTDGVYLPADDRRHFVAWSNQAREDFPASFWLDLQQWYESGGFAHVAAYLRTYDLSGFNAKAPPRKTPAFWEIVDAGRAPEDAELAGVVDRLGAPSALTMKHLLDATAPPGEDVELHEWLADRKNRRAIPHRLAECGYTHVRNAAAKDGVWKVGGRGVPIYALERLSEADRQRAAVALTIAESAPRRPILRAVE